MKFLSRFISRCPWIFVVFAFLLLIAGWTTAFILAGRVNTTQVPLTPPANPASESGSFPATPTANP
jgi:hypothetical protein